VCRLRRNWDVQVEKELVCAGWERTGVCSLRRNWGVQVEKELQFLLNLHTPDGHLQRIL